MTAPVRVSVCIPAYNGAAFIADALRSVFAQSFRDFELLVVDDCSTDATMEIAHSFTDPRLRIHQNAERLGIPRNWNQCVELANGDYICLFHQDDVMMEENLERKVRVLVSDPAISFVHSAAEVLVEHSAPSELQNWIEKSAEDFVVDGARYFRKLLFHGPSICAPSVVARRQKVLDVGGFDVELGYACDYEMWLRLCIESRIAFLASPLIYYRWHAHNASHAYRFERGIEECLIAGQKALQFYEMQTGQGQEKHVMRSALIALTESRRYAAQLERYIENQKTYIQQLEQQRDTLWADVQRIGNSWEEQRTTIDCQKTYIQQLEQQRDTLWADVQRIGNSWEAQQSYIRQLEYEYEQVLSQRLKRLARKVQSRFRSLS